MKRKLIAAISVAAASGVCTSTGLATLTIDLRATGTSSGVIIDSKNVYFTGQPGGTVTCQVFGVVVDADGPNGNEGVLSVAGSFLSSSGGLLGDLAGVRASDYVATGSSNGKQQDLDGDGDQDIGSNNNGSSANFFSARARQFAPFFDVTFLGTVTWTFTGGEQNTLVNFRPRNSSTAASWIEDGSQITSANFSAGTPVTIYTPEPGGVMGAALALGLIARRSRS